MGAGRGEPRLQVQPAPPASRPGAGLFLVEQRKPLLRITPSRPSEVITRADGRGPAGNWQTGAPLGAGLLPPWWAHRGLSPHPSFLDEVLSA